MSEHPQDDACLSGGDRSGPTAAGEPHGGGESVVETFCKAVVWTSFLVASLPAAPLAFALDDRRRVGPGRVALACLAAITLPLAAVVCVPFVAVGLVAKGIRLAAARLRAALRHRTPRAQAPAGDHIPLSELGRGGQTRSAGRSRLLPRLDAQDDAL